MEGLRVGELAALAGVSARVVRLYEQRGLLPEPTRTSSGYRVYQLVDAVRLLRIRRLVELGLSLDEARHALADGDGGDLRVALSRLDSDLAQQQADLERRRHLVRELLAGDDDDLAESDRVRRVMARLAPVARLARMDCSGVARERRTLQALEAVAPQAMSDVEALYGQVLADPDRAAQASRLGEGLERLAEPGASRADVDALVERALAFLDQLGVLAVPGARSRGPNTALEAMLLASVEADMTPLQRSFLQQVTDRWQSDVVDRGD